MVIRNPEHFFYVCNGAVLKDVDDLANFLKETDDGTFMHHVNDERNDFANWTKDILKRKVLAKKLLEAKNRQDMIVVIVGKKKDSELSSEKKAVISKIKSAVLNG